MSVNLLLFGLIVAVRGRPDGPLRHPAGGRASRSLLVAAGSGLTVFMTQSWQLLLCWGVLVGLGTGSMSMAFVATVSTRWFVARRGLVSGVLTAGERHRPAHLPAAARVAGHPPRLAARVGDGRRSPRWPWCRWCCSSCATTRTTSALRAYGATEVDPGPPPASRTGSSAARGVGALVDAARDPAVLAARRQLRDLRRHHQRADRHPLHPGRARPRHAETTAAGLLALVGVFDIVRDDRLRLAHRPVGPAAPARLYYGAARPVAARAAGAVRRATRACSVSSSSTAWTGWPPSRRPSRCAESSSGTAPVVFGWVFASHQLGAAVAASGAGLIRDVNGTYDLAFYLGAGLCVFAAAMCAAIGRRRVGAAAAVTA